MSDPWRKSKGVQHDTWHRCHDCSNWPTSDYDERYTEPTTGVKCRECEAKVRTQLDRRNRAAKVGKGLGRGVVWLIVLLVLAYLLVVLFFVVAFRGGGGE